MTIEFKNKTGNITAATGSAAVVEMPCDGVGSVGIDVRGTFSATLVPEATINNQNWFTLTINPVAGTAGVTSITAAGAWTVNTSGYSAVRLNCSSYTSGTANVSFVGTPDAGVNLNTTVTLGTTDIEIGAVELKDASADVRASISPANTARTTATNVLAVQAIDASGNVVGSAGTSMADDAAFTAGTTSFTPAGGTYKSTRDAVDDNDGGAFAMNAKRGLYVSLETPNADSAMDDTLDTVKVSQATAANLNATVSQATGTNLHAVIDSGSTTAVTQATGTNLHAVLDSGTLTTCSTVTNLSQLGGASVPIGAGTEATAVRVTLPTDGTGLVNVKQGTATNLKAQAECYQGGSAVAAGNPLQVTLANGSVPSHAVTNAGTFVVQENGAALTSLQLIDDTVFTDDTSTHSTGSTKGLGIMAVATPTDANVDSNDIGMVAMTTARQLKVDASGVAVPVTDNSSSLSVDWNGTQPVTGSGNATGALRVELANNGTGTLSTVSTVTTVTTLTGTTTLTPGTGASNLGKAEDSPHASTDVGVFALAVRNDASATTYGADQDYCPIAVNANGNVMTTGPYAHDAASLQANPHTIGGEAVNHDGTAPPNQVSAEGDSVRAIFNRDGRQYVEIGHPFFVTANENHTSAQTDNVLITSAAASLRIYVTDLDYSGDTASNFKLSTNSTASSALWGPHYFPANGGVSKTFRNPLAGTVAKDICFTQVGGGNYSVSVQGFTAA